jgi:hypothetical protein
VPQIRRLVELETVRGLALMSLAVARRRAASGRARAAISALPCASFLATLQLFHSAASVNRVLPAALESIAAVQQRLALAAVE